MCTLQRYLGDDVLLGVVGEHEHGVALLDQQPHPGEVGLGQQLAGHLEVTVLQELHRDEIS